MKALIVGGSSGIGKAMATEVLKEHGAVVIAARRADVLAAASKDLMKDAGNDPSRVRSTVLDVSDAASVTRGVGEAWAALGGLDLVVVSSGMVYPRPFLETSSDIFAQTIATNLIGVANVARSVLPKLLDQKKGHLCLINSLAGVMGLYGYTSYSASKYGVVGFAECLRQELIGTGVSLSVVFPGDTDTPMLEAENKLKTAQTRAAAGSVKVLSPEAVAQAAMKGIASGKFQIVPGGDAKFAHWMAAHMPGTLRRVLDSAVKKVNAQAR